MGRRSRQRERAAGPAGADRVERRASRSERRDAETRATLEPLAPGERPRAVTVAAIVAAILAPANLIAAFAVNFGGQSRSAAVFAVLQSAVLVIAAIGMWRARYWAVLGFQAMLALQVLNLALALTRVERLLVGIGVAVLIGALGTLFWFLVRAMARIQMPRQPSRPP